MTKGLNSAGIQPSSRIVYSTLPALFTRASSLFLAALLFASVAQPMNRAKNKPNDFSNAGKASMIFNLSDDSHEDSLIQETFSNPTPCSNHGASDHIPQQSMAENTQTNSMIMHPGDEDQQDFLNEFEPNILPTTNPPISPRRKGASNQAEQCWACPKVYKNTEALIDHVLNNHHDEENKCKDCDRTFDTYQKLKTHRSLSHSNKTFECHDCNLTFATAVKLTDHQRATHKELFDNECHKCGKQFKSLKSLQQHELTHTGEKPFKCLQCDKAYTQPISLSRHELKHTGEKPYKCSLCDKAFAQASILKDHDKTHTGAKPFKCQHCEKTFAQTSNCTTHERTHTGEKPFACKRCEWRFTSKSGLTRHEKTCKGDINHYRCQYCPMAFAEEQKLSSHIAKIHFDALQKNYCGFCGETIYVKDFENHLAEHKNLSVVKNKQPRVSNSNGPTIKLSGCDAPDQTIEISLQAALHSQTLRFMMDYNHDYDVSITPIPLPGITHATAQLIVNCLNIINSPENQGTLFWYILNVIKSDQTGQAHNNLLFAAQFLDIPHVCETIWNLEHALQYQQEEPYQPQPESSTIEPNDQQNNTTEIKQPEYSTVKLYGSDVYPDQAIEISLQALFHANALKQFMEEHKYIDFSAKPIIVPDIPHRTVKAIIECLNIIDSGDDYAGKLYFHCLDVLNTEAMYQAPDYLQHAAFLLDIPEVSAFFPPVEEDCDDEQETQAITNKSSADKAYQCSHCPEAFAKKTDFFDHKQTHAQETFGYKRRHAKKAFQCEYCDKSYNRLNTLHDHIKLHTGDAPFECKHCGKFFTRELHWKNHESAHLNPNNKLWKTTPRKIC